MSWINPWGALREERARHAATLRQLAEINYRASVADALVAGAGLRIKTLSSALEQLIREKNELRSHLRQAHIRDPKTGRIQKRGQP